MNYGNHTEVWKKFFKKFPEIAVCGRHIAKKMVAHGPNQLVLDSAENLMRLVNFFYIYTGDTLYLKVKGTRQNTSRYQ